MPPTKQTLANVRDRIIGLERIRARDLIPNSLNWRDHPAHQRQALLGLLNEIGYVGALLGRRLDNGKVKLIDGHLRAETTPDQEVPVLILDVNDSEERTILATYDPIATLAETNEEALRELLEMTQTENAQVQALFDDLKSQLSEDLDQLEDGDSDESPEEDEPEEPDPTFAVTRLGDVWTLSDHVLVCGDCTVNETLLSALPSRRCNLLCTDPPYNMHYDGSSKSFVGHQISEKLKQKLQPLVEFDPTKFLRQLERIKFGSAFIFTSKDLLPDYFAWIVAHKHTFNLHIWYKPNPPPLTKNTFLPDIEYIVYVGTPQRDFINGLTFDDYHKVYVSHPLQGRKEAGTDEHPTIKPLGLISRMLKVCCEPGGHVFDPFLGSGTTLIACHKLGRICHAIELSPAYCDLAIRRWQKTSRERAIRQDGTPFNEIEPQPQETDT